MGIYNALTVAATGIAAQSLAMENISGNIANSRTFGFKGVETNFADMVTDGNAMTMTAGSVLARAQGSNTIDGSIVSTNVPTNVAIAGESYMMVRPSPGSSDTLFTKRGDFSTDKDGYLVNGAGYYLVGRKADGAIGARDPIQISNLPISAVKTTQVTYAGNLPSVRLTQTGSEVLYAGPGDVTAAAEQTFMTESVDGGALTIFDAVGNPTSLALRWAKVQTRDAAGTVNDTWNAYYQTSTDRGASGNVIWKKFATTEFNAAGNMASPLDLTIPNLSVNGRVIGNVQFIAKQADLTQYSDSSGTFQPGVIGQDGYPSGTLGAVSIDSKGLISGSYSNGRVVPLWQIDAYTFQNDDALDRADGSAFRETAASGKAVADTNLKIVSSAVEQSNVDIAAEFAEMIQTQSAYSANAKVGTIAQQMLSDVLNMIR